MVSAILENPDVRRQVHRFSIESYHEFGRLGQISEKTELLEGVIVEKMPKDPIHSSVVLKIFKSIYKILNERFMIRPENPLSLGDSEPEPDIAIVDFDKDEYIHTHPNFAHLVIEVSNTTLSLDREKAVIYAKANIPEYWIINLIAHEVEVYKNPSPRGYSSHKVFSKDEILKPDVLEEWNFCLKEYLP